MIPVSPENTLELNWNEPEAVVAKFATVNGDDIWSSTPKGILRRLETWLKKHDIGKDGKTAPAVVELFGVKVIVLTPTVRQTGMHSAWAEIVQNFCVKLWYRGQEYDNLSLEFRTLVWMAGKRAKRPRVETPVSF